MLFTFFLARLCYEICPVRWSGNHLIKQGKYSASPNSLVAMVPFCKYLPTSVSLLDFAKHCRPLHTDTSGGGRRGYSTNVYTVTSITWPYRGLSCRPIEVEYFWSYPLTNYRCVKWSQAQVYFFQWFISNMLCLCHYGPALLGFWFQTDLGREISASFFKKYRREKTFSYHGHALRPVFMLWLVKIYFIYFLFYFIILPHTMNYKKNKNDNK